MDLCWEILIEAIEEEIEKMCPLKQIKIRKMKEPWITNEILEFIHNKVFLLKQAKRSGTREDLQTARIARNFVAGLIQNAKRDYIITQMEINRKNHKKFWNKVHLLLPD